MKALEIVHIKSIIEYNQIAGLPKSKHPLMSIISFEEMPKFYVEKKVKFTLGFYVITLKKECDCKAEYGQTSYDFDEGLMGFIAPNQVMSVDENSNVAKSGWLLVIHPDFILGYQLAKKIKAYDFFHYAVNEALILSEDEEKSMDEIFRNILKEYNRSIDNFSQDVLISQIDLLLTFSNRFYNRQFITRKVPNNNFLSAFEIELDEYFSDENMLSKGLPTVAFFAEKLNLSGKYLSDLIKNLTGFGIQHHIHEKIIDKAKEKLSTTELSVGEIAYHLGFEYPQSFSKLFKSKTGKTALEFRQSFN